MFRPGHGREKRKRWLRERRRSKASLTSLQKSFEFSLNDKYFEQNLCQKNPFLSPGIEK
jgi:hypothetical protein